MTGAQAMVLAAGRGERMRPLTDHCPKPLLQVRGKPLMQYHLEALQRAGFGEVVVNTAWLGQQIEDHFGLQPSLDMRGQLSNTEQHTEQLRVIYSHEGRDFGGALETAGGIARALPLLADVFWLVAGDVYVPTFEFSRAAMERFAAGTLLAHIYLVPNPPHNLKGDFGLGPDGMVLNDAGLGGRHTYSTIGLYRKVFFDSLPAGNPQGLKAPLAPLLRAAIGSRQVSAELYGDAWTDVGTPERLRELNS